MRRRSDVAKPCSACGDTHKDHHEDWACQQVQAAKANRPPVAEVDATLLQPGDTVSITWGRECFAPIRFHSVEVGPFSVTVTVRPGETGGQAWERGRAYLQT